MPFGRSFAASLLDLIFNNQALANVGDASGLQPSSADGSVYLGLHTADPGATGDQTTSEISYTDYARQPIARDDTKWSASEDTITLLADIDFPESSGGTGGTVTHVTIGTIVSGAGVQIVRGAISPTIVVSTGVTPRIKAGTTIEFKDAA